MCSKALTHRRCGSLVDQYGTNWIRIGKVRRAVNFVPNMGGDLALLIMNTFGKVLDRMPLNVRDRYRRIDKQYNSKAWSAEAWHRPRPQLGPRICLKRCPFRRACGFEG